MTVRRLLSRIEMLVVQSRFCIFFLLLRGELASWAIPRLSLGGVFFCFNFSNVHLKCKI